MFKEGTYWRADGGTIYRRRPGTSATSATHPFQRWNAVERRWCSAVMPGNAPYEYCCNPEQPQPRELDAALRRWLMESGRYAKRVTDGLHELRIWWDHDERLFMSQFNYEEPRSCVPDSTWNCQVVPVDGEQW